MINRTNSTLAQQLNIFFSNTPVEKVHLFGSRARDDNADASDVDLLLEFNETPGLLTISHYKNQLEELLSLKVDLLTREAISPRIMPYIEKEMILTYERER